jgi:hypothetical protein
MSGCGARTAAGSLKAVFGLSDVERLAFLDIGYQDASIKRLCSV